jgi:hypothetical protein
MIEEINIQKNKEVYSEFLNSLPEKTAKIILSDDTPILIAGVCIENGLTDVEKIKKVAYQTTMVLLDNLSQDEFPIVIERELQIDKDSAKKISDGIKENIFSQAVIREEEKPKPKEDIATKKIVENNQKYSKNDTYKEPLE